MSLCTLNTALHKTLISNNAKAGQRQLLFENDRNHIKNEMANDLIFQFINNRRKYCERY